MWPRRYTHKIERDVVRAMRPWRRGWYLASSARRRSRLSAAIQVLSPHELQVANSTAPGTVTLRVLQPAGAAHFPEHMWVRPARRVFWFLWCGRAGRSAFVFADRGRPCAATRTCTHPTCVMPQRRTRLRDCMVYCPSMDAGATSIINSLRRSFF